MSFKKVQPMRYTTEINRSQVEGPSGSLYIDDYGQGDISVMFTHAFGGSSKHWSEQLEYLRHNYRAIAFDFRGHGRSESPTQNDFSAESLAMDIRNVADNLGLEKFVLVGHSMGGAASIAYADLHPERVAGLVLVGTPGKSAAEQSKSVIASLESDAYDQVMAGYMKQLLENAQPQVQTLVNREIEKLSKDTAIAIIKALFEYDPLPALGRYTGPKLIISTTRESTQPNALIHQMPAIPNRIVEGTSHWMQMDKPDEFNAILDDFLQLIPAK